jgi:energy-converting hydrogenase Eha subunit B
MATVTCDRVNNATGKLGATVGTGTGTVATFFSSNWSHGTTASNHFLRIVITPGTSGTPGPTFEVIHGQATTGSKTFKITARGRQTTTPVSHARTKVWVVAATKADFTTLNAAGSVSVAGTVKTAVLQTTSGIVTSPPGATTNIISSFAGLTTTSPPTKTATTKGRWQNTTGYDVFVTWRGYLWSSDISSITYAKTAHCFTYVSTPTISTTTTVYNATRLRISYGQSGTIGNVYKTQFIFVDDLLVPKTYWLGFKVLNTTINTIKYVRA